MKSLTLLTGPRGAGKTSLCLDMANKAKAAGQIVAGLLSPARFEGNYKVGIDVLDLRSGRRYPLAQRRSKKPDGAPISGEPETNNWRFDAEALAWGAEVLQQATPCDLLIIDELGPLEFERKGGWLVALDIIDRGDYHRALIVARPKLLATAQSRWPWAQIWRIEGKGQGARGFVSERRHYR